MSNLISIDDIFISIKENLSDNDILENMITYICDNFYEFNYDKLINNILENLENEIFIISFLNPFINKMNTYRKILFIDIIKSTNNLINLKNIFLLDYAGFEQLYNIFKFKKFNNNMYSEILTFIFTLGKLDILISLLDFVYKTKINYEIIYTIIISFMIFHYNLYNENIKDYDIHYKKNYKKLTSILLDFTNNILYPLFELNNIVLQTFQLENTNTFLTEININIINIFFINILDKIEYYYDISIIKNVIHYIEFVIKQKLYNNIYELVNKLVALIDNSILNIHDKTLLLLKLCKIISNDSYKNIPIDMIYYINYYLTNVKFLDWSSFDEKINIILVLSKILFKIYQYNLIHNDELYPDLLQNLLYNIIYYEKECFNIIEFVLKNDITYNTYTLLKETIYGLVNTLNIFVEIEIYLCEKLNILFQFEKYDYIIYKNNLNITSYVSFLLGNNNLYKFNTQTLIHNFIISKYIMLYNQMLYDRLPYIGIDYDKIIGYYDTYFINLPDLFKIKINILQNKYTDMNKFIDENSDSDLIDPLFAIKIENIYKLPNINENFEKITLRLLIKESSKNPFTRDPLNLTELDEYNKL